MKTSNKKVNEKIILLSIIGSLDAIKEEAVSIDEIEKFLFSPHIYHKLKQKGYSGDILQIIEELDMISMPDGMMSLRHSGRRRLWTCSWMTG